MSKVDFSGDDSIDLLEHDHDPPGDGPLLCPDQTSTLAGRSQFGNVYGHLSGADTNTEAIDDTTDDQHGDVLRRTNDG